MPTVLRIGSYRFYLYSHEPNEPPHIHIDRDSSTAKFWLEPVGLANNIGFNAKELRKLQGIVLRESENFTGGWEWVFWRLEWMRELKTSTLPRKRLASI